jgi:hypothetical protein
LEDRLADLVGQLIAHAVADLALAAPVDQAVHGPRAIGAQQQLDPRGMRGGDLLEPPLGNLDLAGGRVGPGAAGAQDPGERFAVFVPGGEQRVKPEAALVVA